MALSTTTVQSDNVGIGNTLEEAVKSSATSKSTLFELWKSIATERTMDKLVSVLTRSLLVIKELT